MTKLFSFLPLSAWIAVVAALLTVVLALFAVQALRLSAVRKELDATMVLLAEARQLTAERTARVAQLTRDAANAARDNEEKMAKASKENVHAITEEKTKFETALAVARADARGLRNYIANFAATGRGTGETSSSARPGLIVEDRAQALGNVLATCRDESVEDAGELEDLATRIRGLQRHVEVIEAAQADYWASKEFHP